MSLLLNIDTATEVASVCVTLNGSLLALAKNEHQREHASFVHTAITDILHQAGYTLKDIDAFAVTSGPGSYTGLRVGMATAKGFCYAFSKPLIAVNTLEVMANAALEEINDMKENVLLCPMIDARRMEVFTGLYDLLLTIILPPGAVILEESSFNEYLTENKIIFFGSGSVKFKGVKTDKNALFQHIEFSAKHLGSLADKAFQQNKFSDVSYSQPNYFKDFYTTSKG